MIPNTAPMFFAARGSRKARLPNQSAVCLGHACLAAAPVLYEAVLSNERLAGMDCANQPLYEALDVARAVDGSQRREVRWQRIYEAFFYECDVSDTSRNLFYVFQPTSRLCEELWESAPKGRPSREVRWQSMGPMAPKVVQNPRLA